MVFHMPPQVDIPAQRLTHTDDLHTLPAVNRAVDGGEERPSVGRVVQRATVSDTKPLEETTQSNDRLLLMIAIEFAS